MIARHISKIQISEKVLKNPMYKNIQLVNSSQNYLYAEDRLNETATAAKSLNSYREMII